MSGRAAIERGRTAWVDLGSMRGSAPAKRRPVLVVSGDAFNRSALATVIVVVVSSNTALAEHPGNVFLPSSASGLPKDSVANVTQPLTLDRADLEELGERLPAYLMDEVDAGLRLALAL